MTDTGQILEELRMECHVMALNMVRLDSWARSAHHREDWVGEGEILVDREEIRARRSMLLRQMWAIQGRHNVREALRAGY